MRVWRGGWVFYTFSDIEWVRRCVSVSQMLTSVCAILIRVMSAHQTHVFTLMSSYNYIVIGDYLGRSRGARNGGVIHRWSCHVPPDILSHSLYRARLTNHLTGIPSDVIVTCLLRHTGSRHHLRVFPLGIRVGRRVWDVSQGREAVKYTFNLFARSYSKLRVCCIYYAAKVLINWVTSQQGRHVLVTM